MRKPEHLVRKSSVPSFSNRATGQPRSEAEGGSRWRGGLDPGARRQGESPSLTGAAASAGAAYHCARRQETKQF